MKESSKIPVGKVSRAAKFVNTGVKIGGNYIKHYSRKLVDPSSQKDQLHEDNSRDIYNALSELKGSALKVAQMLSMDKNMLPTAYQQKFAMSQYSAPPLSYPLVEKIFRKYFDKNPEQIFDTFSRKAANAASIGQVHKADLDGKSLAVKVQYPGVADSVSADLRLVKPIALRLFNLNEVELDEYMKEVESKLLEETNYTLELEQSLELSAACKQIPNTYFPKYYPEYSSEKVITMDWIEGTHLDKFLETNPDQKTKNKIGQALWNFINYQIHVLKKVHADPHPGNFLISKEGKVGIIDFGCVKEMPLDFYQGYFGLLEGKIMEDDDALMNSFIKLGFIFENDSDADKAFFFESFKEMLLLLGKPMSYSEFDFGDDSYFEQIYLLGDKLSKAPQFRKSKHARGSKHGLYINRTFFGLYNILNQLKAKVITVDPAISKPGNAA